MLRHGLRQEGGADGGFLCVCVCVRVAGEGRVRDKVDRGAQGAGLFFFPVLAA